MGLVNTLPTRARKKVSSPPPSSRFGQLRCGGAHTCLHQVFYHKHRSKLYDCSCDSHKSGEVAFTSFKDYLKRSLSGVADGGVSALRRKDTAYRATWARQATDENMSMLSNQNYLLRVMSCVLENLLMSRPAAAYRRRPSSPRPSRDACQVQSLSGWVVSGCLVASAHLRSFMTNPSHIAAVDVPSAAVAAGRVFLALDKLFAVAPTLTLTKNVPPCTCAVCPNSFDVEVTMGYSKTDILDWRRQSQSVSSDPPPKRPRLNDPTSHSRLSPRQTRSKTANHLRIMQNPSPISKTLSSPGMDDRSPSTPASRGRGRRRGSVAPMQPAIRPDGAANKEASRATSKRRRTDSELPSRLDDSVDPPPTLTSSAKNNLHQDPSQLLGLSIPIRRHIVLSAQWYSSHSDIPQIVFDILQLLADPRHRMCYISQTQQNLYASDIVLARSFPVSVDSSETRLSFGSSPPLETLDDIIGNSLDLTEHTGNEVGWNCWVQARVLEVARRGSTHRRILKNINVPQHYDSSKEISASVASRVDFVYALTSTELDRAFRWLRPIEASGSSKRSYNHSTYNALCNAPISISIETKAGIDGSRARSQICIWAAAQFEKLNQLARIKAQEVAKHKDKAENRSNRETTGESEGTTTNATEDCFELPALPLLVVTGPIWTLLIASRTGQDEMIGATNARDGLLQLIAVLQALLHWSVTVHYEWFVKYAMPEKPHSLEGTALLVLRLDMISHARHWLLADAANLLLPRWLIRATNSCVQYRRQSRYATRGNCTARGLPGDLSSLSQPANCHDLPLRSLSVCSCWSCSPILTHSATMDDRKASAVSAVYRRTSVNAEPVTTILKQGEIVFDPENPDHVWDSDEEVLAALGYRPEFKREFSLFTTFSVSFAVLGLLPSFATTLFYGMGYAGTAGMTWGWLVAMVGIQCVALGMAEICSAMPTSGGLYYAAAVLAPPGWGPLAAWITGWSNWLGQITGAPSVNYGTASMTLAAASIMNPDYVPQNYQVFLLTTLLMLVHMCISSMPTKWVANFNAYGSTFNMIALIVVIVLIPAATNRESQGLPRFTSSAEVWGTIYKGTDWPAGVGVLMSFLGIIWTLSGYDSPFHLSEECSNANIASPRAIVMTASVGGTFGWFLQLVVAYTVIDITSALESDLGQPFAAYLQQVISQKLTIFILAITIIAGFSMGQGCMVAASRVTFAYARDDCFPLSRLWKQVNPITKTPVNAVLLNTGIGICLLLLIFGGPLTIGSMFSIGAIAQYIAFTIPIFIRLFLVGNRFRPGPWNLGSLSLPIGSVACAFVILMTPIMCFPAYRASGYSEDFGPLTAQTMNWTSVVYGGPMLGVLIWWYIDAHKWFNGPKINLSHMMVAGRDIAGLDGIPVEEDRYPTGSSDGSLNGENKVVVKANKVEY
ncbi:hypothetical protein FH972_024116 [Carpinus fangiana]|uniref:PD-(D/E)XK nuclease-like domain-containing protein n=1 Tax=Carpinus fangiana TaxID=176857 RepID=A0A5N6KX34_9ROSI|nr:hypothetical protein FH972_024116 [Carpinus fangiana]